MTGMVVLCITRGLPGCGKSTAAMAWVGEDPGNRARVGRDALRRMLHGGYLGTTAQEEMVSAVQLPAVAALLGQGVSVVVDDTNLYDDYVARLAAVAAGMDVAVEVWDMTGTPVDTCVDRDAGRSGSERVGEVVIREMHRRWTDRKSTQQVTG